MNHKDRSVQLLSTNVGHNERSCLIVARQSDASTHPSVVTAGGNLLPGGVQSSGLGHLECLLVKVKRKEQIQSETVRER